VVKSRRLAANTECSGAGTLLNYRADIDGLRAIAVLSVVLFHLEFALFEGGFVGVDVFFVISGYLITSIIKQKYENQDFKLSDFYTRRIRRLLPPLIATIAATLFGAALIMTPYDMVSFSRSAVAALFSLSNIIFYLESGYWDTASELKPLLHTWSLGVEEQFYVFWPALIIGLLSIRRFVGFGTSLALITVLGAVLCIWFTGVDQSAAFYLLPFRVFQFAAGALLIPLASSLQHGRANLPNLTPNLAFWVGLSCILISVVTMNSETVFPGYAVLLPTLGAALVLLSGALQGQLHAPARALMQNRLSIWLGRVSYSMYLVHWPLIVLFRYHYGLELTPVDQFVLGVSTLVATCILHYGIERRYYQRVAGAAGGASVSSGSRFAMRTLSVAGLLALVATSAWKGDGWAWRFPSLSLSAEQIEKGEQDRFRKVSHACLLINLSENKNCNLDAKSHMLVLGNSTDVDGFNFINAGFGEDNDLNLIMFGNMNECANFREESGRLLTSEEQCQKQLDMLFDTAVVSRLNMVLYSANRPYEANKGSLLTILKKLKEVNPKIQIITLGGYINTKRPCVYYVNKANSTDACVLPENVLYFENKPEALAMFKQFRAIESHYINRVDLLCKNRVLQTCRTRTEEGIPFTYDGVHHSLEFAELSGRLYAKQYPDLLNDLTQP
jgi:peptidoglycan/LPS O-acetylase OafA/YrhL